MPKQRVKRKKHTTTFKQDLQSTNCGLNMQAVWANIWYAVLAMLWPALFKEWFPLCGRPMPEVLLSRLH